MNPLMPAGLRCLAIAVATAGSALAHVEPELVLSTYLGGDGSDAATDSAVDPLGNFYVIGNTNSGTFDIGAAFVVKYAPDLQSVLYFATIGGTGKDEALAVAADSNGSAVILIRTETADFPTRNALQPTLRGDSDFALVKLTPDGQELVFSTYLGGDSHENFFTTGADLVLDSAGNIHLVGSTLSDDFPVTAGAFQESAPGGPPNGIVAKVSADGSTLLYATYLGGTGSDECHAIGVDGMGNAYVAGITGSEDFPLVNPLNASRGVATGAVVSDQIFIAKLNPQGTDLDFSTYLIGGGTVNALALTPQQGVLVAGSSSGGMTTTPNGWQRRRSGGFVLELHPELNAVTYGSNFGETSEVQGMAVDSEGNVALVGRTTSDSLATTHPGFPEFNPLDHNDNAFAVRLDPSRSVGYSVRFGGLGDDEARAVAFLSDGTLALAGSTKSFDFPTVEPFRDSPVGDEAFVARIANGKDTGSGGAPGGVPAGIERHTHTDHPPPDLSARYYRIREIPPP